MMSFSDFDFNKQLLSALDAIGWEKPSPIQAKTLPIVFGGYDVIGIAPTGTGKTGAYLLPILKKLNYAQGEQPRALILVPTKELVLQVEEHFEALNQNMDLRMVAIYGGVGPKTQIEKVNAGCDVIVATTGRFMDLYLRGEIPVKSLNTMVLDEADKLMDMGFMPQIHQLLEVVPNKRQNMLFSATFSSEVEELSKDFLEFPKRVEVAPQATTVDTITQQYYEIPNFMSKIVLLQHLLEDKEEFKRVLVFTNTKLSADNIGKFVERKLEGGVRVIHSNKGQNSRINSIKAFESGEIRTLVATDVSARGIDIKEVSHVINFEIPTKEYENYVHRIGRTGRANHVGCAISFVNEPEKWHLAKIEKMTGSKVSRLEKPEGLQYPETDKDEMIGIAKHLDWIKRQENPDYKGAFHTKKKRPGKSKIKNRAGGNSTSRRKK